MPTPPRRRAFPVALATIAALATLALLLAPAGKASAQEPGAPAAELRREAERLRGERRFPEALAAYRAVTAAEPGGFEDRFWIAKLESWTGALDAAERDLAQLVAERPDDYDSRIALADVRRWRGDAAGSRLALDQLRLTHPDDPEVTSRLAALRTAMAPARWEADLEYQGERYPGGAASDGATLGLRALGRHRLRWRAAVTVQDKFDRTETRGGGDLGLHLSRSVELTGTAFVAPGAEVLPRGTFGAGLTALAARGLLLSADYRHDAYADAQVHTVGPSLEWYTGPWLLAARYRYTATRFDGVSSTAGDHAGLLSIGYQYGLANIVRVFGFAGGESFGEPSRDRIGSSDGQGAGVSWRQFVSPALGFEAVYAFDDRDGIGTRHTFGLRLVRRW
ncbi:MAG TPA: YaiO family outer membrane beta-barrel protein [Gemmatimonadales bacterium]|nr:YaiO family outer membrane beta-barrel protein [Gemmatimonadales bacterium]